MNHVSELSCICVTLVCIYIASSLQKLVTAQIECESECARPLYKVLFKVTAICFELPGI